MRDDNFCGLQDLGFQVLGLAIQTQPTKFLRMEIVLQIAPVVIVVLMVAVVLVLFMGLGGMAFGGRITPMARNKLMRVRVCLQGLIVFLVLITVAAAALK